MALSKSVRLWLHGLGVAMISAIADSGTAAFTVYFVAPELMMDAKAWKAAAALLIYNTGKTLFAYLKSSPLPNFDCDPEAK